VHSGLCGDHENKYISDIDICESNRFKVSRKTSKKKRVRKAAKKSLSITIVNTNKKRDTLPQKAQNFVREYFAQGFNATAAAKAAGYSEKTAYSAASRLLRNVEVQKALKMHLNKLAEKVDLKGEDILRELKYIGFADISDLVADMSNNSIKFRAWNEIPDSFKKAIESVKLSKDGVSIKMHSKPRALELLGKNRGLFADKVVEMSFEEWMKMQEENAEKPGNISGENAGENSSENDEEFYDDE
jgi:phage terminase small subunit